MYFGEIEREAAGQLIALALAEDLGTLSDVTTEALIPPDQTGSVEIVARSSGVLAGLPVVEMVFAEVDANVEFRSHTSDGELLAPGQVVAQISGPVRSLLIAERTCLNFLTHLSGVATLTRRYVEAIAHSHADIYDTRKTLPGWRALEKYAVTAGGGKNHRMGLYDMILIKDNHLAGWRAESEDRSLAAAVRAAQKQQPPGPTSRLKSIRSSSSPMPSPASPISFCSITCRSTRCARPWRCVTSGPRASSSKPREACRSRPLPPSRRQALSGSVSAPSRIQRPRLIWRLIGVARAKFDRVARLAPTRRALVRKAGRVA